MQIQFSLDPNWDETENKKLSEHHASVSISVQVSPDNFPTKDELDTLYERFAAAIGAKRAGKALGGNA